MVTPWYWKVDGREMPTPIKATIDEYDLDSPSTGRPESGFLNRERVRTNVMRIGLEFHNLTPAQARILRTAIAPAQVTVTVRRFYGDDTRMMYAGDRHWTEWRDSSGEPHIDLQVQFSEY